MCTNKQKLSCRCWYNNKKKNFNDNRILTWKIGYFIQKLQTQYHQFFTQKFTINTHSLFTFFFSFFRGNFNRPFLINNDSDMWILLFRKKISHSSLNKNSHTKKKQENITTRNKKSFYWKWKRQTWKTSY